MSEIVDMSFKEMIEGLFNTDFLTSEELETICKAAELYAEAKLKNKVEADAAPDGDAVEFLLWMTGNMFINPNDENPKKQAQKHYELFKKQ